MIRFADDRFVSNPGSPVKIEYQSKVNDDGSIELVESGCINIHDFIQSFAESVDIRNIVARYRNTGDVSMLSAGTPRYGDVTTMPQTLAEALQLKINADRLYDSLPTDIKAKFDNDRNKFFVQSGSDFWKEALGDLLPTEMQIKKSDVNTQPIVTDKEVKE